MKTTLIGIDKLIRPYLKRKYKGNVLFVFLDSSDDCGEEFARDVLGMGDGQILVEDYLIIEDTIDVLKDVMMKYKAKDPYMRLYTHGEYADDNT